MSAPTSAPGAPSVGVFSSAGAELGAAATTVSAGALVGELVATVDVVRGACGTSVVTAAVARAAVARALGDAIAGD